MPDKIPAELVKDAEDIQSALRQIRDLTAEVKEKKDKIKTTPEFEDVKAHKKLLKKFEKENAAYSALKNDLKIKQSRLKDTSEYANAAEAAKQLKEYKDSINEVGRHMAERILDKKLATEEDATADEV